MLMITDSLAIDERELEERFVRASGPGGQNVNKVATAVELRFDIAASALAEDVKQRLTALAGSRVTDAGVLLIDSRAHRTQSQNREEARERLATLIRAAFRPPRRRQKTRPTRAAKAERVNEKKKRGRMKSDRAVRVRDDE